MKQVIIAVEEDLYRFYQKIGKPQGDAVLKQSWETPYFSLQGSCLPR